MRAPKKVDDWRRLFIYLRGIEYHDNHIYTKLHPYINELFNYTNHEFHYKEPCHIHLQLHSGETINIGDYQLTYNKCLIADCSHFFTETDKDIDLITQTSPFNECHLDIYVNQNIIETYINDGYYVLSHIIYHLDDYIQINNYIQTDASYQLKTNQK